MLANKFANKLANRGGRKGGVEELGFLFWGKEG